MALMPSSEDSWLTRPEVGERLRVPEKTLAQWASQQKGPRYARFGRHVRYRLADVIAWENAQFRSASPTGAGVA
jgi:predicted DNA-binding transcriptional regulator AlpA